MPGLHQQHRIGSLRCIRDVDIAPNAGQPRIESTLRQKPDRPKCIGEAGTVRQKSPKLPATVDQQGMIERNTEDCNPTLISHEHPPRCRDRGHDDQSPTATPGDCAPKARSIPRSADDERNRSLPLPLEHSAKTYKQTACQSQNPAKAVSDVKTGFGAGLHRCSGPFSRCYCTSRATVA